LEVNNPREKGKKLLSSLRDLEQKKLLVNSKKLTLKKDFSKEEKMCVRRNCFLSKQKDVVILKRKNQRIFLPNIANVQQKIAM